MALIEGVPVCPYCWKGNGEPSPELEAPEGPWLEGYSKVTCNHCNSIYQIKLPTPGVTIEEFFAGKGWGA
eukprot:g25343.t1